MQTIRRSVKCANNIVDVKNSNYTTMLWCYTRDNLSFMLPQALHVETEMKNLNFHVTLLVQKGVGKQKGAGMQKGVGTHPATPLAGNHEIGNLLQSPLI